MLVQHFSSNEASSRRIVHVESANFDGWSFIKIVFSCTCLLETLWTSCLIRWTSGNIYFVDTVFWSSSHWCFFRGREVVRSRGEGICLIYATMCVENFRYLRKFNQKSGQKILALKKQTSLMTSLSIFVDDKSTYALNVPISGRKKLIFPIYSIFRHLC